MKFGTLKPRVKATQPTPKPRVNTDITVDPKLSLEEIYDDGNSARTKEPLSKKNHNYILVDKMLQSLSNLYTPRHTHMSRTRDSPRLSHGPSHFTRSKIKIFLAQSVQALNNHSFQHHIANHVFHENTG